MADVKERTEDTRQSGHSSLYELPAKGLVESRANDLTTMFNSITSGDGYGTAQQQQLAKSFGYLNDEKLQGAVLDKLQQSGVATVERKTDGSIDITVPGQDEKQAPLKINLNGKEVRVNGKTADELKEKISEEAFAFISASINDPARRKGDGSSFSSEEKDLYLKAAKATLSGSAADWKEFGMAAAKNPSAFNSIVNEPPMTWRSGNIKVVTGEDGNTHTLVRNFLGGSGSIKIDAAGKMTVHHYDPAAPDHVGGIDSSAKLNKIFENQAGVYTGMTSDRMGYIAKLVHTDNMRNVPIDTLARESNLRYRLSQPQRSSASEAPLGKGFGIDL